MKRTYEVPLAEAFMWAKNMSLLNSLSADLIFDDMEDGGEIEGTGI